MRSLLTTFLVFLFTLPVQAQEIKLDEIMQGEAYVGFWPENQAWSASGKRIYFDWNPEGNPAKELYHYDFATKKTQKTSPEEYLKDPKNGELRTKTHLYFQLGNAIYTHELVSKKTDRILLLPSTPHSIELSKEGLFFMIDDAAMEYKFSNKSITTLAQFKRGNDRPLSDSTLIMKEEMRLFEYHRERAEAQEFHSKSDWKLNNVPTIRTGNFGQRNVQLDPSSRYIIFRLDEDQENESTEVMNFISADGKAQSFKARPKVGHPDRTHRLGIYDLKRDTLYFADFSTLPEIRKRPAYLNSTEEYDEDRKIIMHPLKFNSSGSLNAFDIRSYDNKDRWISALDLETGQLTVLDHQHDEAWIGGPGISSWNMVEGTLAWLKDDKQIYFQSEKTGYSHLYLLDVKTRNVKALTSGNWEVHEVKLSQDGQRFFLQTNHSHPGNRDFEVLTISSNELKPILSKNGYHEVSLSPDEKNLCIHYSNANTPWELFSSSLSTPEKQIQLTESRSTEFKSINWIKPRIVELINEKQQKVYARLYEAAKPTGSAVIFVHGAGYLQNAHHYWSTYHREYMFHHLLMEKGISVLDIDYRASEGYGRDHRTAIYRQMGDRDLEDQLIGRQFLIDSLQIDENRIGIYGGSYGGFITLMALFKNPGKFKCGAALRSVTDWMHYNHEYTSNILNYPETDPEAYRLSSPINYAANLSDHLLILHGMVDDNVQFQDVVRLNQRLIELKKENWTMALYPVEAHGFKTTSSWIDEYRRILELFETHLLDSK